MSIEKHKARIERLGLSIENKKSRHATFKEFINNRINGSKNSITVLTEQLNSNVAPASDSSYSGLFTYIGNTDGAVIGPLVENNFEVDVSQIRQGNIKSAVFHSNLGEPISLDHDEDNKLAFNISFKKSNECRNVTIGCHQQLIRDGGFEEAANEVLINRSWDVFSKAGEWSTSPYDTNDAGFELQKFTGNAQVELDSHRKNGFTKTNSSISQTITPVAGRYYELKFRHSPRHLNGPKDTNSFGIYLNGKLYKEYKNQTPGWHNANLLIQADSNEVVIEFRAHGTEETLGALIDDISFRQEGHEYGRYLKLAKVKNGPFLNKIKI